MKGNCKRGEVKSLTPRDCWIKMSKELNCKFVTSLEIFPVKIIQAFQRTNFIHLSRIK